VRRRSTPAAAFLTALVLTGASAGEALAADIAWQSTPEGFAVTYDALPGETNQLTVTQSGPSITFADPGARMQGCSAFGASTATCTVPSGATVDFLEIDLGDRDDVARSFASPTKVARWDDGTGNDIVDGGPTDDSFLLRPGGDVYDGGDGFDFMNYSASATSVVVRLDGVANDGPSGENDNVRPTVESVRGSPQADSLTGSSGPDTLMGWDGSDFLVGNGGGDTLLGDRVCGGADLPGGGNDFLFGLDGDDELQGCGGNDHLAGGLDADFMSGGAGRDTVAYASSHTTTVEASIGDGPNDGNASDGAADARDDIRSNVEDLIGSTGDDVLTGNEGGNLLEGIAGDDWMTGGAGPDDLRGGTGLDMVLDYQGALDPVTVRLDDVANDGPDGDAVDNVRSDVEAVHGGSGDDTIVGSEADNHLFGNDGDDELSGGGGSDLFQGGRHDDTLLAADGLADVSIDCGDGVDSATVDRDDPVTADCETETRPSPPAPPPPPADGSGGSGGSGGPGGGTTTPPRGSGGIGDLPAPADGDAAAPVVSSFKLSRRRFAVGRKRTAVTARKRRVRVGTVFRYALSEEGRVTIRIDKRVAGVRLRVSKRLRCLVSTRRNRARLARELKRLRSVRSLSGKRRKRRLARERRRRRCTAPRRAGKLAREGREGVNRIAFSGRLGRRGLRPGSYKATIVAADAAGNVSAARAARFRVVKR
jgi:Ca2+-binding RTX toxin-like protein